MRNGINLWIVMLVVPGLVWAQAVGAAELPAITVTGTAVVRVVPDEVEVRLRIESLDKDLRKSVAQTDARVQKLLALTRELKIEPTHVQTSFVNVDARWTNDGNTFKGYESASGVNVTLQDVTAYTDFVARAVETAQVQVCGIEFRSTRAIEKRAEARRLALRAAHAKAAGMAAELGQTIGRPLRIGEVPGSYWGGKNRAANSFQVAIDESAGDPPDVATLAPGQIEVTARVEICFELVSAAPTTRPTTP